MHEQAVTKTARDKNLRPCLPLKPQEKIYNKFIDSLF